MYASGFGEAFMPGALESVRQCACGKTITSPAEKIRIRSDAPGVRAPEAVELPGQSWELSGR